MGLTLCARVQALPQTPRNCQMESLQRMQVGEILLRNGWVTWEQLALALTDQADLAERAAARTPRIRLCSLLVSRGAVDFDHGARALGEHFGCAAVLRRHLERRDRQVPSLLRTELARKLIALPVGRLGNGSLIICVRDPSPALHAALERATRQDVVLAVAPASYVERLVARTYADVDVPIETGETVIEPAIDFDIELGEAITDDVMELDDLVASELDSDAASAIVDDAADDIAIDIDVPPEAVAGTPRNKPLPVEIRPLSRANTEPPVRDSLDALIASFPDIDDREWLLDVVMGFVAKRWTAALLLAIGERRATGLRGHGRRLGANATHTFSIALSEPSLVQLARDERRVVDEPPPHSARSHSELVAALDGPARTAAAPIVTRDAVRHVLVVGDAAPDNEGDTIGDLEVLAEAMSEVLSRVCSP